MKKERRKGESSERKGSGKLLDGGQRRETRRSLAHYAPPACSRAFAQQANLEATAFCSHTSS